MDVCRRCCVTCMTALGLGSVELADGRRVTGFLCESAGLEGAEEITRHGGWRAWRQLPRN